MPEARRSFWRGRYPRSRDLPVEQWNGPAGDRPRVLLECPPHASPSMVAAVLEDEGFEVAVCEGPSPTVPCALARDAECTLAGGADIVVNLFGIPEQQYVDIVHNIRRRYVGLPIVIEVPEPKARENEDCLRGCHVAHPPFGRAPLVDHIWSAFDESQAATD